MAFDFSSLFGNQSQGFNNYGDQMRQVAAGFQPWINRGNQAGQMFFDQSGRLVNNPNSLQDQIAGGFYESPYQKLMQDLVMKRMNFNAANTGMLGSGAANRALQNELTAMTGQFENDYINRGMQTYGMGFNGLGRMDEMGQNALNNQAGFLEQAGAADLKANQSESGWLPKALGTGLGLIAGGAGGFASGGIPGMLKGAAGFLFGDPKQSTVDAGGYR